MMRWLISHRTNQSPVLAAPSQAQAIRGYMDRRGRDFTLPFTNSVEFGRHSSQCRVALKTERGRLAGLWVFQMVPAEMPGAVQPRLELPECA